MDTDVSPEKARVILDGEDIGKADNFDGFPDYLYLTPGEHTIEFRAEGYRALLVRLTAGRGMYYGIDRSLERLEKGKPVPGPEVEVAPPAPGRQARGRDRAGEGTPAPLGSGKRGAPTPDPWPERSPRDRRRLPERSPGDRPRLPERVRGTAEAPQSPGRGSSQQGLPSCARRAR